MAIALFGANVDTCIDMLGEAKQEKLKLTHQFDTVHARFDEIMDRDSDEVTDWISTAIIGKLLADQAGGMDELTHITLPGTYLQLPMGYKISLLDWKAEDGKGLCVPIYRPVNTNHADLNHGLQATARQIIAKCQNIDQAAEDGEYWGKRLDACTNLIDTLETILKDG